jgi:hypothetical protein
MIRGLRAKEHDCGISRRRQGESCVLSDGLYEWPLRQVIFWMCLTGTWWSVDHALKSTIVEFQGDDKVSLVFSLTDYMSGRSDRWLFKCVLWGYDDLLFAQWCAGLEFWGDGEVFLLILLATQIYFHTSMSVAVFWTIQCTSHVKDCQLNIFSSRLWLMSSTENIMYWKLPVADHQAMRPVLVHAVITTVV